MRKALPLEAPFVFGPYVSWLWRIVPPEHGGIQSRARSKPKSPFKLFALQAFGLRIRRFATGVCRRGRLAGRYQRRFYEQHGQTKIYSILARCDRKHRKWCCPLEHVQGGAVQTGETGRSYDFMLMEPALRIDLELNQHQSSYAERIQRITFELLDMSRHFHGDLSRSRSLIVRAWIGPRCDN